MRRRFLIAGGALTFLLGATNLSVQARPAESTCQSALAEANREMSNVSELEAKAARLGEYKAYSWRSVRENLDHLEEHEAKKDSLQAEINKSTTRINRLLPVLKQCAQ
jgi:hypothetical protein